MGIRAEKWNRISHLDEQDRALLKNYVTFMGAVGALVAWLAQRQAGLATFPLAATSLAFALFSTYGISSVLRNYADYLRCLVVINSIETESRTLGLRLSIPTVRFRAPVDIWHFLLKLLRTTRGPFLAIYVSCTPIVATMAAPLDPHSRTLALPILALLLILAAVLIRVHWLSFDRADSAGFVVLAKDPGNPDKFLVAMIYSYDGKWGHPKGHRHNWSSHGQHLGTSRPLLPETATRARWREFEEELSVWIENGEIHQGERRSSSESPTVRERRWLALRETQKIHLSQYFLDTYGDPEPEPWRGDKAVRLWVIFIRQLTPQPKTDARFETSITENKYGQWRSVDTVLTEGSEHHRAPYVAESLQAALSVVQRQQLTWMEQSNPPPLNK